MEAADVERAAREAERLPGVEIQLHQGLPVAAEARWAPPVTLPNTSAYSEMLRVRPIFLIADRSPPRSPKKFSLSGAPLSTPKEACGASAASFWPSGSAGT